MGFSIEQIKQQSNYQEVCNTFFSLVKDEQTFLKLKDILYNGGTYYHFRSKFHCIDNPLIERSRRVAMASLLMRNPETYEYFRQNNINIFHGTNANALPTILKYGMNSHAALEEKGIPVLTGEEWSRMDKKRTFISFTDVLDIAEDYSSIPPKNGDENLSFNIIIGTSEEKMNNARITPVESSTSEIGVEEHFPLESINCICVPEDKVNFVKRILSNYPITVLGMHDLSKKPYYIDDWEDVHISKELYEKKIDDSQKFSSSEIQEIAKKRSLFNIKEFIEKFKNIFGKEVEEIGRKIR